MWPFVLYQETLELPAPLYEARSRIATWLNASAATAEPWTGVVNRETARVSPAARYAGGLAIARYHLTLRLEPHEPAGQLRSAASARGRAT